MPDYSQGKIYKIVGNGKVYVGSTMRPLLSQRLAKHRSIYKLCVNGKRKHGCTSFECLSDPECYIELLEMCPCDCIDELRRCEGKWIRDLECVNKLVAGRTTKEYYEENKEVILEKKKAYREANKDKLNANQKACYQKNKEEIEEKRKEHYEANKEAILQQKKAYYEANKEAIKEKAMVKYWEKKAKNQS